MSQVKTYVCLMMKYKTYFICFMKVLLPDSPAPKIEITCTAHLEKKHINVSYRKHTFWVRFLTDKKN